MSNRAAKGRLLQSSRFIRGEQAIQLRVNRRLGDALATGWGTGAHCPTLDELALALQCNVLQMAQTALSRRRTSSSAFGVKPAAPKCQARCVLLTQLGRSGLAESP